MCNQEYELKSSKLPFKHEVLDGAYSAMMRRIQSNNNPNFFLLKYSLADLSVHDFAVIPRHFFVPSIIRQRRPLAPTARRAGWIGCNISLRSIPEVGKIFLIKNGITVDKKSVLRSWRQTAFLSKSKVETRGWTVEVLLLLDRLPKRFMLAEMYAFEAELQAKFPRNRFVRDKIRQQLQILREQGIIEFLGKGEYRKLS